MTGDNSASSGGGVLPLSGVRVLDLSRVLAGPMAAQMLGDFGADVIKVEQPEKGDLVRQMGAAKLEGTEDIPSNETSLYLAANRNKRSITVDLSKTDGQAIVRELAEQSDVLIENYIPGTLAKFALDYDSLRSVNPRLVYCSVSGFGQSGPRARQPGFDAIFQALGGLMSLNGHPDGHPGSGPLKVGPNVVDGVAALYATVGIFAGLKQREATGIGQHIDIGLLDCALHWISPTIETYLIGGKVPQRSGNHTLSGGPSTVLRCQDGMVYFICGGQGRFDRLCQLLEIPELANDPRFSENTRWENRYLLAEIIQDKVKSWSCVQFIEKLERIGCPVGKVNNIEEALADAQVRHRELVVTMDHPLRNDLKVMANPIRMGNTSLCYRRPPLLGEHTEGVLREILGLDHAAIAKLRNEGSI